MTKFGKFNLAFFMKNYLLAVGLGCIVSFSAAQTVSQKLQQAFSVFEKDPQLKYAISSLYVMEANTGQTIFSRNANVGLAPASTQKIITSVTAFELLGKNYQFQTNFGVAKEDGKETLIIKASGDPTLGSWRWEFTKEQNVLNRIISSLRSEGLKNLDRVVVNAPGWDHETIPDGWIWQDIGNYYGAGSGAFNWRENQFDLILKSGSRMGDAVEIVQAIPDLYFYKLTSRATSAAKGTGDNAYIYLPAGRGEAVLRGTIPVNENRFVISGSLIHPAGQFVQTLNDSLKKQFRFPDLPAPVFFYKEFKPAEKIIHTEISPTLDSLIYYFNKKSINLYGEALVKTLGYVKKGTGSTDSGLVVVKNFWKQNGLEEEELNMVDGSGLSPLNRITTHAQAAILKFAREKPWFTSFYNSLPEYNGMKMKSGTIIGVKGFCGYHRSRSGREYIFSFLVNNYHGSPSQLINKMYKVLDVLK